MTIASTVSEIEYAGDGVTTVFDIPFEFDDADGLKVVETTSGNPVPVTTGFSITGGSGSNGTLTRDAALPSGTSLKIIDDPEFTQPVDYVDNEAFPAETHESALDRGARISKRLRGLLLNCVRVPDGDPASGDPMVFPTVAARRGMLVGWADTDTAELEAVVTLPAGTALSRSIIGALLYPQTADESAAGVTPVNLYYPPGHLYRYGTNSVPGTTNMAAALRSAQAVLNQAGGGTLTFEPEVVLLSSVVSHTVRVPVAAANFQPADESHQCHVLLEDVDNIVWDLNGATLRSNVTNGGEMFILDGVRNFEVRNGTIESVTAKNGSGTVTTTGMNAFGVTSQARDSYNLKFKNLTFNNVYAAIYVFGDTASSFRARGIVIDNLRHEQGIYTLAFHDNGDDVHATGVQSINTLRELFVYGSANGYAEIFSKTGVAGFGATIKAYDRDTKNWHVRLRTEKNISQPHILVQSQHAPAVQATPKRVINCTLEVDNQGTSGLGPAVGFEYYRDAVLTGTSSNNLWTGITLKGIHEQPPVISSTQVGAFGSYGTLNSDAVTLVNGSMTASYVATGFLDNKQKDYFTFTPNLKINGSATGITYGGATVGEGWRDGQFVEIHVRVVLTSKGASAGAVTLDLPFAASLRNFANAVITGKGNANLASLAGPLTGHVAASGTTITLQDQDATAIAALDNTNLTNTSDFEIWARYPI